METEDLVEEHDTPVATAFTLDLGRLGLPDDVPSGDSHIFQLQDEVSLQLARGGASRMIEERTISEDPLVNVQILFDIATGWTSILYAGPAESLSQRLNGIRALQHFVITLSRMAQEGNGLSAQEIVNMASPIPE